METTMHRISGLAFAIAVLLPATIANAGSLGRPCTNEPQAKWLTLEALQGRVEALGFKVQKGKIKNACGEIYALDSNGSRVELFVDPTSGTIVGRQ
jgi:hypothetical protein